MLISEVASFLGGELYCSKEYEDKNIQGIQALEFATNDQISFLTNPRYQKYLESTKACAVILAKPIETLSIPQIIHKNPYAAMAKVALHFYKRSHSFQGQSELAFIHPEARIAEDATIYPFCYIDEGASVGSRSVLYPGVFVGAHAKIGEGCLIYSNASLLEACELGNECIVHSGAVIGGDGFGFAPTGKELIKIPQVARALIGDDVEIGANSTVDRGAFEDTLIEDGSKLDSQVHIAHGVKLGKYAMLCGQTEIAGSTKVGTNLTMAGQSAIGPSLEVCDHVTLGPRAGLTNSQKTPGTFMGMPLSPIKEWRKQAVIAKQLPDMLARIRKLEAELESLKKSGT